MCNCYNWQKYDEFTIRKKLQQNALQCSVLCLILDWVFSFSVVGEMDADPWDALCLELLASTSQQIIVNLKLLILQSL